MDVENPLVKPKIQNTSRDFTRLCRAFCCSILSYHMVPRDLFIEAKRLIEGASRIIIFSHRHPDADTIGSNLALSYVLQGWGKSVTSACVDPPPSDSQFLDGIKNFAQDFQPENFDLFISVDCGAHYMTRFHEKYPVIFAKQKPFINIDHHASNDFFGTLNIVDPLAASTTQLIYYFLRQGGIPIERKTATALLHGLYFDTGSFKHSNVTPETLRVASELMWKGADFRMIVKQQFKTNPFPQLKLWGRIFERVSLTSRKFVRSFVTHQDFSECGAPREATTGAIDFLNSIPQGKFCTLISQDGDGNIKGSFRTRDSEIDLAKLASYFGGGGHKKAAGFQMPGKLVVQNEKIRIE